MVRADQGELTKVPEIATFSSLVSLGAVHDQQRAPYEAAAHRARWGGRGWHAAACGQGEHVPASMCSASEIVGLGLSAAQDCHATRRSASASARRARVAG